MLAFEIFAEALKVSCAEINGHTVSLAIMRLRIEGTLNALKIQTRLYAN